MKLLFRTAYGIAKHKKLFTDFKWICNLQEANGLQLRAAHRDTYQCEIYLLGVMAAHTMKITLFVILRSGGATRKQQRKVSIITL